MSPFEAIKHEEDGAGYWSARELVGVLGYAKWDKFQAVIEKAKTACETSGNAASDHFLHVGKMIEAGKGARREIEDWRLSRYACYLIVQNADPEKPIVALGQTYFASQTRFAELTQEQQRLYLRDQVAEHNKSLAAGAYEVGVVSARDFAIFSDHGYMGLYNGERAKDIYARKGLKKGQHILDWMETEELADNLFRQVHAESQIRREQVENKDQANRIHFQVGKKARQTIAEMGDTMPEDLPTPAISVQELPRQESARIERQSRPSLWEGTEE